MKDLCSSEIVGYAMVERMIRHLVVRALFRAASPRRSAPGLIVHSDSNNVSASCSWQLDPNSDRQVMEELVP